MRNRWFILNSFFILFMVTYPLPIHAIVGEESVTKAEGPVDIEADELIYDRETQTYEGHGQVEVNRGDLSLKADHAQLNMGTKELVAWGNVLLREGEDVIECQRLEVNVETRLGRIHQARLYLKDQNFHITGREVEKLGENHYRLRDGSLTTCDAKRPPWKFTMKEIEVKQMALGGWGIAKGPIFYFEDIPVLYFPWGAFPVRRERQSGFLIPQAGYSNKYGPELKNGFYWAFAKDMDATFYFDWLGDRGFKEGLEYRYAFTRDTKGEAKFHFIDDQVFNKNRYAFFIEHQQKFPYDFYLKGDINHVSDHEYLRDFDEDLPRRANIDSRSARQLKSVLFGGKNWDQFSLVAQTAVYDDLTQPSNDETLQKLPQISFYAHPQSLFKTPLFYDLASSYNHFWRERGVEAHRGDLFPRISYPVRLLNVLKFESDVGLRETLYKSHDDPTDTYHGWESRETLDAGMQMSTEFYRVYDGKSFSMISDLYKVAKWMHTIEPTIGYRYSPRVNQDALPVFDGVDRIPYTNQITYGITQRLVGRPEMGRPEMGRPEKEGVSSRPYEYGKLMISQNYSLGDPFTDVEGKKRFFSNIRGELWWNFGPYLSARWDGELNPYRGNFDIFNVAMTAKDRRNDVVVVQYRNTRSTIREINLDARVKTIPPLYLFGSFYYNLFEGTWVQGIFGAEYQAQCWSVGFVVEDINRSPDGMQKKELKFNFYFNLLNIGSVGHKPYFMGL
jgi:LPS-assembly protein